MRPADVGTKVPFHHGCITCCWPTRIVAKLIAKLVSWEVIEWARTLIVLRLMTTSSR